MHIKSGINLNVKPTLALILIVDIIRNNNSRMIVALKSNKL